MEVTEKAEASDKKEETVSFLFFKKVYIFIIVFPSLSTSCIS